MKTKKIIASVLSVLLIFGSIPMASLAGVDLPELPSISSLLSVKASAADSVVSSDGLYLYSGSTITGLTEKGKAEISGEYTIPTELDGQIITEIGKDVFIGSQIQELVIPEGIGIVHPNAFGSCLNLKKIIINANNCKFMSSYSAVNGGFYYSSFLNDSNVTEVHFGKNISVIPDNACRDLTRLKKVTFDENIVKVGKNAFYGCSNLADFDFKNVTDIYDGAFCNCVFNKLDLQETITIGADAFKGCKLLENVSFPKVKSIGDYAFANTGLTELVIPESTSTIEAGAFNYCTRLEKITLNSNNCKFLSSYSAANGGYYVTPFLGDELVAEYTFGKKVKYVPANACRYLEGLKDINIEGTISLIGNNAFNGCSRLENIDLKNVTTINEGAFKNCSSIKEVDLPAVTNIGSDAFNGCSSLETVNFPKVITIDNYAFAYSGIYEITIPECTETIVGGAFNYCNNLEKVTINSKKCSIIKKYTAVDGGYYITPFLGDYFVEEFVFGNNVTEIKADTCRYLNGLKEVYINGIITAIEADAFNGCIGIENIYCPNMTKSYWNDNVKTNIGSNNDILSDEAVTYHWGEMPEVKTVTVKFNIDGKITSYTGEAGAALSAPQAKKDGYEFTGWSPAFGGKYPDADTTYTAQFKKIEDEPQESETITVSDASTKVGVTYEKDAFDEAVQLVTKEISDIHEIYGSFALTGMNQIGLYDAYMKNSKGEKVQPNKPVTIKLPVPQSAWNQILTVCHLDDSGNRRLFRNVKAVNGYITLEIDHFSGFVIYEDVKISNYTGTLNVDYRTKLTFSIENDEIEESSIHWFVNGKDVKTGSSYIIDTAAEKEYKVQVKVIAGGEIISESETETVKVKTNFFAKLIAFFRNLFGKLPEYVDNIKVK